MCRLCLTLPDGEGLRHHVAAHARESVYSYDEIDETVRNLRALAAHCDDCRTTIHRDARPATTAESWDQLGFEMGKVFEGIKKAFEPIAEKLLYDSPPADPKARALWARKNRSTGPARPSGQAARRPRRHQ